MRPVLALSCKHKHGVSVPIKLLVQTSTVEKYIDTSSSQDGFNDDFMLKII